MPDPSLDMDLDAIRTLGYRIVDTVVAELARPDHRAPFPTYELDEPLKELVGGPVPREGQSADEVFSLIAEHVLPASGNLLHPGLMGYVLSGSLPAPGLLGGLVNALNLTPYDPVNTYIESTVVRWIGQMIGFSDQAAGYLTTGGSWANLVGLAVARQRQTDGAVRKEGVAAQPTMVAYVSDQGHSSLDKSMDLLGMGVNQLRKIPVDARYRIRLDALEEAIQEDLAAQRKPFCLIGNAGTVNTGMVDPLDDLADMAERYDLWFHVDGAYGGIAAMATACKPLFSGIERADSLTTDPHKWLNIPIESGCILVKNQDDLFDTFNMIPPYLRAAGDEYNIINCGFELTRTNRALKVWMALKQYGVDAFSDLIEWHVALVEELGQRIAASDDLEVVTEPSLSICCFRFVPQDLDCTSDEASRYLDELNLAIEMKVMVEGKVLVSGTELHGRRVLRLCIVSRRVTREAAYEALEMVCVAGRELHRLMAGKLPL